MPLSDVYDIGCVFGYHVRGRSRAAGSGAGHVRHRPQDRCPGRRPGRAAARKPDVDHRAGRCSRRRPRPPGVRAGVPGHSRRGAREGGARPGRPPRRRLPRSRCRSGEPAGHGRKVPGQVRSAARSAAARRRARRAPPALGRRHLPRPGQERAAEQLLRVRPRGRHHLARHPGRSRGAGQPSDRRGAARCDERMGGPVPRAGVDGRDRAAAARARPRQLGRGRVRPRRRSRALVQRRQLPGEGPGGRRAGRPIPGLAPIRDELGFDKNEMSYSDAIYFTADGKAVRQ
jgi:hypothetical protein